MTIVNDVRVVSNSEVQSFKWCRRNWWLAWHRGLVPKTQNLASPANTGTRIHAALAAYYVSEGETPVDPLRTLTAAQAEDLAVFQLQAAELAGVEDQDLSDEREQELRKAFQLEQAMIEGYVQWLAETGVDAEWEVIGSEMYVEVPLSLIGYVDYYNAVKLIAKLDARVRSRITGQVRFIDHKTVGSFIIPTLGINQQMLHYHLINWLNTGDVAAGALYNMLRKVKRARNSKPPYYERRAVNHNEHELRTYQDKLRGVIQDMDNVEYWLENGLDHQQAVYPTPNRDCSWKCQFFKICRMFDDGSRVDAAIEDLYEQRDPLSYYEGKEQLED